MRAIVATDFAGKWRKLVWITENMRGISAGLCYPERNAHASYHRDGKFHYRLELRGHSQKLWPEQRRPLPNVDSIQHLLGTAGFYCEAVMGRMPWLTTEARTNVLIKLQQSIFVGINCASFTISILPPHEVSRFQREAYSFYGSDNFKVVRIDILDLDIFKQQKVGLVVYRAVSHDRNKCNTPTSFNSRKS